MELFSRQKHGTSHINTAFGVKSEFEPKPTTLASCANSINCFSVIWNSGLIPPVVVMVIK